MYKRNLLLYDVETESLWSQLLSEAVTGPLAGVQLRLLPSENTTWGAWENAHPDTRVLSFATGYARPYGTDPYAFEEFPRNPALLVSNGSAFKIYPFSELKKAKSPVVDRLGGEKLAVVYDHQSETAHVEGATGAITSLVSFLDDLKEFYPQAEIYKAPRK